MKDNVVSARLSGKEAEVFRLLMARENLTSSEAIRAFIREAAAKRGIYAVGMVKLLSRFEVGDGNSKS